MSERHEKARRFYELHTRPGCFLMPNAWDIGSARLLESVGFPALATTSAGIAFSLGRPDHGYAHAGARVDRDAMLARVGSIAAAISLPLNADLEGGYAVAAREVATTVRLAIECGADGGNLEDFTGDRRTPLLDTAAACERIVAAREAIDASGIPFVLVARTDPFLVAHPQAYAESVRRANRYREAGADCLFVPGPSDAATIGSLVKEVAGPMSVVMGLTGQSLSLAQLADLGVRRVSIGASLARAMYYRIREAAQEMASTGTFRYAEQQIPQSELNALFDMAADTSGRQEGRWQGGQWQGGLSAGSEQSSPKFSHLP